MNTELRSFSETERFTVSLQNGFYLTNEFSKKKYFLSLSSSKIFNFVRNFIILFINSKIQKEKKSTKALKGFSKH